MYLFIRSGLFHPICVRFIQYCPFHNVFAQILHLVLIKKMFFNVELHNRLLMAYVKCRAAYLLSSFDMFAMYFFKDMLM